MSTSWESLPDKPFYDVQDIPELKFLEDAWQVFKIEIPVFDPKLAVFKRPRDVWDKSHQAYAEGVAAQWMLGWDAGVEWYNYPLIFHGSVLKGAADTCPRTVALLQTSDRIQLAGFAILTPRQKMHRHVDDTGRAFGSTAVNLALDCDDANIHVEWSDGLLYSHHHANGKLVAFDSTQFHFADNESSRDRTILYLNFKLN